ncbi:MAG: exodeoxyribonuclease VII small subunit [Planctomycetota bacterium]
MASKKKHAAKKSPRKEGADAPDFESSIERLRDVVTAMEQGNLSLSGSLEKYEEGVKCLKDCYRALDEAKRKIELLIDLDEDGRLVTTPFDTAASGFRAASGDAGAEPEFEQKFEEDYETSDEPEDDCDEEPEVDGSDRLF